MHSAPAIIVLTPQTGGGYYKTFMPVFDVISLRVCGTMTTTPYTPHISGTARNEYCTNRLAMALFSFFFVAYLEACSVWEVQDGGMERSARWIRRNKAVSVFVGKESGSSNIFVHLEHLNVDELVHSHSITTMNKPKQHIPHGNRPRPEVAQRQEALLFLISSVKVEHVAHTSGNNGAAEVLKHIGDGCLSQQLTKESQTDA